MKFDVRANEGWTRAFVLDQVPRRMYDADGCEIRNCFAWDDETGEVERYAADANGVIELDDLHNPIVIRETRPLPWRTSKV